MWIRYEEGHNKSVWKEDQNAMDSQGQDSAPVSETCQKMLQVEAYEVLEQFPLEKK